VRLWTLHPKYLDPQGLAALWREALLAKAVLGGRTRGYRHHPQLERFRPRPSSIRAYLSAVHEEAASRGYRFDKRRIGRMGRASRIRTTTGQLAFERKHLMRKLRSRSPAWLRKLGRDAHPLFRIVPGPVEPWERRKT